MTAERVKLETKARPGVSPGQEALRAEAIAEEAAVIDRVGAVGNLTYLEALLQAITRGLRRPGGDRTA